MMVLTLRNTFRSKLTPSRPSGLRALRHRDFRALWIGFLLSAVGTWMQIVAQSLLVLRLAHGSAFALGCVSLSQASAFFLFALLGGGLADRVDRRRLLIATETCLMLLAVLLGLLTLKGIVTVPIIAAVAFVSGVILSVDQPARAALVSTLVPHEDLLSAVSLQSAVFNAASIVGPAVAGVIVHAVGLAAIFFVTDLLLFCLLFLSLSLAIVSSGLFLLATMRLRPVDGDAIIVPRGSGRPRRAAMIGAYFLRSPPRAPRGRVQAHRRKPGGKRWPS